MGFKNADNQGMTPAAVALPLTWLNRFAQLGPTFGTPCAPTPLPEAHWVAVNHRLATDLGWPTEWQQAEGLLDILTGNRAWANHPSLASVYSGHQFGVWAGQLGDGRALWLGELDTPLGPLELQLKGAGQTPYSRMGDGRAVLRSSIREFLCSEAMHGLGIPTTRALALTGSKGRVIRETLETAAVVTRVAPSFLRFGHFEHFAAINQPEALKKLADFVCASELMPLPNPDAFHGNPYAALLQAVVERTADLLAHWQAVGFCHGVMNTDNMSLLGLTIDYGPFQFLDGYDPQHICNHSDSQGRYAFQRQPQVAYWNLFCLGQAFMPLVNDSDLIVKVLETYTQRFSNSLLDRMRAKLGLTRSQADDGALIDDICQLLAREHTDYSIFWRRLSHAAHGLENGQPKAFQPVTDLFLDRQRWQDLALRLQARWADEPAGAGARMLQHNPKMVLRNHLGEQAIRQAQAGDFSEVQTLLKLLSSPFDEHPGHDAYADFPPDWASSISISCSS